MNDIDIEEGRRLAAAATAERWWCTSQELFGCDGMTSVGRVFSPEDAFLIVWLRNNAAAMFDAIETGRQWETIARRTWNYRIEHKATCLISRCTCGLDELSAFRDRADRTPTPTDGA